MDKNEFLIMSLTSNRIKEIVSDSYINNVASLNNASSKYINKKEWIN